MGERVNVAGIDYSSHAVDVVLVPVDGGAPSWHRFPLEGNDAFDRTRGVATVMPGRGSAFWDPILAVGIEHPAGRFGTRDMTRVQGAILSCIPDRVLVEPWPPAKWRKAVGLKGNATKHDVESYSYDATIGMPGDWPREWPQDAHDAHCIALATRQAITKAAA